MATFGRVWELLGSFWAHLEAFRSPLGAMGASESLRRPLGTFNFLGNVAICGIYGYMWLYVVSVDILNHSDMWLSVERNVWVAQYKPKEARKPY